MTALTLFGLIVAHLVGDYLLQSHWMATRKTESWTAAIVHGLFYTIPFIFVTQSVPALAVICGTHIIIDRYRLAKYLMWAKNQLAPNSDTRPTWAETKNNSGYPSDVPVWMATWLMIIADNTVHMLINAAAVVWL